MGLTLSRMFSRPYGQVVGTYFTFLMDPYAGSAFALTFALTVHRYIGAATYPIVGRLSDRTEARLGRRVPYMVFGLLLMAVGMYGITVVHSYWGLIAVMFVIRQGHIIQSVPRLSVTPDVFGRSRWLLGWAAVAASAVIPAAGILAVIRFTWDQDDQSSWNITFRLVALGLALSALCVLVFVREAPASRTAATMAAKRSWRAELRDFLGQQNAPQLVAVAALLVAGVSATSRLFAAWAERQLGAGGDDLAGATVVIAILSGIGVPLGLWLAGKFHPTRLGIVATVFGGLATIGTMYSTEIWMYVLWSVITVPLAVAAITAHVPLILKLVPRADNVGESIGFLMGPIILFMTIAAYAAAAVVDFTDDYRYIWLVAAVCTFACVIPISQVTIPDDFERVNIKELMNRVQESSGLGDGKIVERLFGGEVEDADVLGTKPPADVEVEPTAPPPAARSAP